MKVFYFLTLVFLFSCESVEEEHVEIELIKGRVASDIVDESSAANEQNEESIWSFYQGRIGSYEQQVVLEIGVLNNEVTGRYFYARQQNFLALEGSYDTLTKEYNLIESYRGKITGYIRFIQDNEGNLEGTWSKLEDSEPEPFSASKLSLDMNGEQRLNVDFLRYDHQHEIQIYSGVSNESDLKNVIDEIIISRIDEQYFSFHYSITGGNGHVGSMDGIGVMIGSDSAEYRAPTSGCILSFVFKQDSIFIAEKEDCSFYRGMRAHFGNALGKVQKGLAF